LLVFVAAIGARFSTPAALCAGYVLSAIGQYPVTTTSVGGSAARSCHASR
jgi:hypothetical protein